ncbi:preprotein translocase subunit SecG [Oceanicella actignis]|uniref:Protein-export membrane protein SecG n=1 Tax=Oceanicella actignis TaxID=1189325 RepID=A0A1M7RXK1_9RHOB|nr:preprotein translocase subunit SecG [Oceanicella actignis]TYO90000.1 protein translocase subunit secG [Oceanicella actignis]SES98008.1 protein translocase subunit secG [Oceanicella actignis]SHN51039.1 preprotein translocase subunit SecG [Oceanicella actignis]
MENVLLIVHLILAVFLIGLVLLQRSEGGALGIGGGGGGLVTGRGAATALSKATWMIAAGFVATSLALTILAAQNAASRSVLEKVPAAEAPAPDAAPLADDLKGLLVPPPAEDPSAPPAAD